MCSVPFYMRASGMVILLGDKNGGSACKRSLMVCLLMFMLVAALNCRMVLEEAVLVFKACHWMKRFSRCVVFLGRPDLHLSWILPVVRKR